MINDKKIIVVITARAGSKGIPMKNVRPLMGMPLFLWSVEAAKQSKYVDTIILSTNCDRCKREWLEYVKSLDDKDSVKFIFIQRTEELSTDTSKNEDALIHAVNFCKDHYDLEYGIIVNLQPTSPVRGNGLLDRCIEAYDEGGYDSLLTAKKDTPFLWQQVNGKWEYTVDKNHCCNRKMRQEFKEDEFVWHDCGSVFITDKKVLLDIECRIGKNPCIFEVEGLDALQIDEEFDFSLIEQIAHVKDLKSLV